MSSPQDGMPLRRLPSMKALLFFNTVGKHLNLVRAGRELHLTQGALSRQLKSLEDHLGLQLFRRGPRGLTFTQEGEMLYAHSRSAFDTLNTGLRRLSVAADREALTVSVARSFALRVLCRSLPGFVAANPDVDLQVDTHRFSALLETSGADIAIRLSSIEPAGNQACALTDDLLWAVAAPAVVRKLRGAARAGGVGRAQLLEYAERDHWQDWMRGGHVAFEPTGPRIAVGDSATLIEMVEAGTGGCITRACLVREAIREGRLARIGFDEMRDGQRYHAVCAPRSQSKRGARAFLDWLRASFPLDNAGSVRSPEPD